MIYLYTIGFILLVMLTWVVVESAAYKFAKHHPEFGAARRLGKGGCCGKCHGDTCDKDGHD